MSDIPFPFSKLGPVWAQRQKYEYLMLKEARQPCLVDLSKVLAKAASYSYPKKSLSNHFKEILIAFFRKIQKFTTLNSPRFKRNIRWGILRPSPHNASYYIFNEVNVVRNSSNYFVRINLCFISFTFYIHLRDKNPSKLKQKRPKAKTYGGSKYPNRFLKSPFQLKLIPMVKFLAQIDNSGQSSISKNNPQLSFKSPKTRDFEIRGDFEDGRSDWLGFANFNSAKFKKGQVELFKDGERRRQA